MYVLLCSYPPFDGETDNEILRKVMRGKFTFPEEEWGEISDEAHDFVRKLMCKYPRRRPSAKEALAHPWLAKFAQPVISNESKRSVHEDGDACGTAAGEPEGVGEAGGM